MQSNRFSNQSNINIIYNISIITITYTMSIINILANFDKYAISDCPFICMSVYLLATLQNNGWTDCHEIVRVGGTWCRKHIKNVPFNPLNTGILFHFSEESMPLSSIAEKRLNGFSWFFFRKGRTWHKEQLETFSGVTVNHLNPGSIYLFPGSVLVCNIMEKLVKGFHDFFNEIS